MGDRGERGEGDASSDIPEPSRRARSLDEATLDRVLALVPVLPEPLAALVLEVDIARDAGDATGIRKRLFDVGIGVVRYAFSVGAAALATATPNSAAPRPVADALRKAFKLTDGRWCELVRTLRSALPKNSEVARALAFASSGSMGELLAARNLFVHGSGNGDDAPVRTLAVLEEARALLGFPLFFVAEADTLVVEARRGVPKRAGVWRREGAAAPADVVGKQAYVALRDRSVCVTPWLPAEGTSLRLVDSPLAAGRPWRFIDAETGEHREHAALDVAVRRFMGDDGAIARPPVDRPALVGRDVVVSLVTRALREAALGQVRVMLLTAAQGGGSSRVLKEATEAASSFGLSNVLEVFGSMDRRGPLGGLRFAVAASAAPELDGLRRAIDGLTGGSGHASRAQIEAAVEAIEEALIAASQERGLLVTVDDAQWLDEQTLAVLRLLTERATRGIRGRLALLVAGRSESVAQHGFARFVAQIDRDVGAGATRMELAALSDAEASRLVQNVVPVAAELERHTVEQARGLPFYLVQPILVWTETGALEWRDGAWHPRAQPAALDERAAFRNVLTSAVPGVAELVEERLAALFDAESQASVLGHQLLVCASLEGASTTVTRLRAIGAKLERREDLTDRVIDSLVEAKLLERQGPGTVRVAQPIVARALLDRDRRRGRRDSAVRALLQVLEEAPPRERDARTLAEEYWALGDAERAILWHRRAIDERMAQGAFADARELAEVLAKRETGAEARALAALRAVTAISRAGDQTAARARLDGVSAPPGTPAHLEARMASVRLSHELGSAEPLALETLVADADALGIVRLSVEARMLAAQRSRGIIGRQRVGEALGRVDQLDAATALDMRYRLLALDLELAYETSPTDREAFGAAMEKARQAALDSGSEWAALDVANDAAVLQADVGELDLAIGALEHVAARAGKNHFGSLRRKALLNASTFDLRAERPAAARNRVKIAEEEARSAGDASLLATTLSVRGEAELRLGELASARTALDESIAIKRRVDEASLALALLRRADVLVLLERGDEARADAVEALRRAGERANVNQGALARLWLAMDDVRKNGAEAAPELSRVVASLEPQLSKLRAAALRKLEEARRLLDVTPH